MIESVQEIFKDAWERIRHELDITDFDHDYLWRWWPTIRQHEPDYQVLVNNLRDLPFNPYLALLTVYYYGFAAALQAVDQESLRPLAQGELPAPPWLEKMVLEGLAEKYGDKH